MKTIIFFNAIANFKSPSLDALKSPDAKNILVINPFILAQLNEDQKSFFDKIHVMDPVTAETTLPLVNQYAQAVGRENIDLVTHDECCTPIVSYLIDHFGLPGCGVKNMTRFIDKIVMKDALNAHGVRTPRHVIFDREAFLAEKTLYVQAIEAELPYPFVIKPISLYGSVGFRKIADRTEFLAYAEQIVHSSAVFQVEEFIAGTLFHCDAIVRDSKILFTAISEYLWPIALFKHGYPTGSIWLLPADPRWKRLDDFHEKVIAALAPPDGATHCELFLTENQEVVFLEIAARPSGALVIPMIEHITGVNLELAHFALRLRRPVNIQPGPAKLFSLFCYVPKKNGKIIKLQVPPLKSAATIDWHVKVGEVVQPVGPDEDDILLKPSHLAATIIATNTDFTALYADFCALKTADYIISS